MSDERSELLSSLIRDIPDFPKKGIVYKDITPLLGDGKALGVCIDLLAERLRDTNIDTDVVAGMESRGFIFGAALAKNLGVGFVPIRKPGKLPADTYSIEYELEYGTDTLEVHQDAFKAGANVTVVDDLIATGGTAAATGELIRKCGAKVAAFAFVINLSFLNGTDRLGDAPVVSLLTY